MAEEERLRLYIGVAAGFAVIFGGIWAAAAFHGLDSYSVQVWSGIAALAAGAVAVACLITLAMRARRAATSAGREPDAYSHYSGATIMSDPVIVLKLATLPPRDPRIELVASGARYYEDGSTNDGGPREYEIPPANYELIRAERGHRIEIKTKKLRELYHPEHFDEKKNDRLWIKVWLRS